VKVEALRNTFGDRSLPRPSARFSAAASEQWQKDIEVDRVRQNEPFLAAIGRKVCDADCVRVGDLGEGCAPDAGSVRERAELFGLGANGAVEAHHEVFLSMADETADPKDFSTVEIEIDIGGARGAKSLCLEDEMACRLRSVRRKQIPGVAAHHEAHKAGRIKPGERTVGGNGPVLQHGHVIAEVEDLIQSARDVENRNALVAQTPNEPHQYRYVRRGERRCRLVQDEYARLDVERLGDLDDLPPAEGQSPDRRIRRFDQLELVGYLCNRSRQAPVIDYSAPARVSPEAHVFRNGQMGRETQLLLHHSDARLMSFVWRQRCDGVPID
jgi:hypothetical protein